MTFLLAGLVVFLTACDNQTNDSMQLQSEPAAVAINNHAWMREKLPAQTLAYFRLPTLWNLLFEAKGDSLHVIQQQSQHKAMLDEFKQGLVSSYQSLLPDHMKSTFELLIQKMDSPLEVAIIAAEDGSMVPNSLIATRLKNTSSTQLNELLEAFVNLAGPQIKLLKPLDDQGRAKLIAAMVPISLSYDEKTGQLALFSGLSSSSSQLDSMLAQTSHAPELNDIFTFENSVDDAGLNLEFWLNVKTFYQLNKGLIPAKDLPLFKQLALDKINFIWAGTAAKNNKSELIFHIAMPDQGVRQVLPRVNTDIGFKTAGRPRSVWQIAFPTVAQWQQGFDFVLQFMPDSQSMREQVENKIKQVNEFLGIELKDIYRIYGQKTWIVTDDSGTWFASRILDKKAHTELFNKLGQVFKTKASVKKMAGVSINESIFSTSEFEELLFGSDEESKTIEQFLSFRQYGYYLLDGDYLIQAFRPQVLADRANSSNKIELKKWLSKQQKHKWDSAIFAYSKEVRDAPRDIYYGYLNALTMLSNFAKVEIDLFRLPTAQQLNLPQTGRFGFSLDSSTEALTFKLSYEYSLVEGFSSSGSFVAVALLGVMMAYAIPAYRDYTVKSKVSQKMYPIYEAKSIIENNYQQEGSYPNTEFLSESFNQSNDFIYNPKNGQITVYFSRSSEPELFGKEIILTPTVAESGYIEWSCSGTVEKRYYQEYFCY